MRRRSALTALLIALMVPALAGPASAGGPTSVLLSAPETGQTASLHASGSDYHAMAELVSAFDMSSPAEGKAASGQEHATGPVVTATWLIHDVQVWRVDRIYLDARGGPWIATQLDTFEGGSLWDQPVTWHVPENGKQLVALLEQLGVIGESGVGGTSGATGSSVGEPAAGSAAGDGTATEGSQSTATNESEADGATGTPGVVWGLAGLALGIALALAGVRLSPTLRRGPGSADERDADSDTDTDDDWVLTDELSSVPR